MMRSFCLILDHFNICTFFLKSVKNIIVLFSTLQNMSLHIVRNNNRNTLKILEHILYQNSCTKLLKYKYKKALYLLFLWPYGQLFHLTLGVPIKSLLFLLTGRIEYSAVQESRRWLASMVEFVRWQMEHSLDWWIFIHARYSWLVVNLRFPTVSFLGFPLLTFHCSQMFSLFPVLLLLLYKFQNFGNTDFLTEFTPEHLFQLNFGALLGQFISSFISLSPYIDLLEHGNFVERFQISFDAACFCSLRLFV